MNKLNGEAEIGTEGMDIDSKLDLLIEGQIRMEEAIAELSERVANLSLENTGFGVDDLD